MDDIHRLHTVHALDQLAEQPQSLKFGQSPIPLDVVRQIAPFAVLQEDIEIRLGFLDVDKIDDMLMLASPEQGNLTFEVFQL